MTFSGSVSNLNLLACGRRKRPWANNLFYRDRASKSGLVCRSKQCLLDHLVGDRKQSGRNVEIKCPGRLEVNNEIELTGLLNGQIGGLCAAQYSIHVRS